jgi:hypothetical protein
MDIQHMSSLMANTAFHTVKNCFRNSSKFYSTRDSDVMCLQVSNILQDRLHAVGTLTAPSYSHISVV